VQTVRHFFPDLRRWLDALPDTRDQEAIIYPRRFLAWWGVLLYVLQLGSRRQLDYHLDTADTEVLPNVNRLAETAQTTRPVHDTLDHFLGHTTVAGFEHLRQQLIRRLLRMKVLDDARLLGHVVVSGDGTGWVSFRRRHCDQCLRYQHGKQVYYLHQVFELKLLGPSHLALSVGTEFIENPAGWDAKPAEQRKQDCELNALGRAAPALKRLFPQLKICLSLDGLFACGALFQIARDCGWNFVVVFKEGRLPALWTEFQQLLTLVPQQRVAVERPDGTRQVYRWVNDLDYTDSERRCWRLHALQCEETSPAGTWKRFAWLTQFRVARDNVIAIASHGGRDRWHIENEGFNRQKNSGLNLEHLFSIDPVKLKLYYLLLQIAHVLLQLVEKGSLLRQLAAAQAGRTVLQWLGSLKNLAQRLLESLRQRRWPEDCFATAAAARLRLRVDTS
jgi:hypothetical protein